MHICSPCAAVHVIESELNLQPSAFPALLSLFTQEELRHFETKVEKHSHYQEQLELSHQKLQHVEALGDKEHIKKSQEKYFTLAEKTREIGYKVRRNNSVCQYALTLYSAIEHDIANGWLLTRGEN